MAKFEIPLAQAADLVARTTQTLNTVINYTRLPEKLRRQLITHQKQADHLARQINAYERKVRNGF